MTLITIKRSLFVVMSLLAICTGSHVVQYKEATTVRKSIVYGIPYGIPNPSHWHDRYGDRLHFYQYASVEKYQNSVDTDFERISEKYNTVIIFLPLADTAQYRENIVLLNMLAHKHGLWLLFTLLPEEDYYTETSYLTKGSEKNRDTLNAMDFLSRMSRVWKIGVWYGWSNRVASSDVTDFYAMLPDKLKQKYACWLDEEFILGMRGLRDSAGDAFLIVTEWYQQEKMKTISALFAQQMVITGYAGAKNHKEWQSNYPAILDKITVPNSNRLLGVWMYYDIGDGANEACRAYFPDEDRLAGF